MSECKFSPGDIVRVKNWGGGYTTFSDWFVSRIGNLDFKPDWAVRYAYDDDSNFLKCCHDDKRKYKVLYVSCGASSEDTKVLIEEAGFSPFVTPKVYLIDADALEGEAKRVTMRDIEKKFGCKIEIIAEKEDKYNGTI